jgi:hypothetical protein
LPLDRLILGAERRFLRLDGVPDESSGARTCDRSDSETGARITGLATDYRSEASSDDTAGRRTHTGRFTRGGTTTHRDKNITREKNSTRETKNTDLFHRYTPSSFQSLNRCPVARHHAVTYCVTR